MAGRFGPPRPGQFGGPRPRYQGPPVTQHRQLDEGPSVPITPARNRVSYGSTSPQPSGHDDADQDIERAKRRAESRALDPSNSSQENDSGRSGAPAPRDAEVDRSEHESSATGVVHPPLHPRERAPRQEHRAWDSRTDYRDERPPFSSPAGFSRNRFPPGRPTPSSMPQQCRRCGGAHHYSECLEKIQGPPLRLPPFPCRCGEMHWRNDCPTYGPPKAARDETQRSRSRSPRRRDDEPREPNDREQRPTDRDDWRRGRSNGSLAEANGSTRPSTDLFDRPRMDATAEESSNKDDRTNRSPIRGNPDRLPPSGPANPDPPRGPSNNIPPQSGMNPRFNERPMNRHYDRPAPTGYNHPQDRFRSSPISRNDTNGYREPFRPNQRRNPWLDRRPPTGPSGMTGPPTAPKAMSNGHDHDLKRRPIDHHDDPWLSRPQSPSSSAAPSIPFTPTERSPLSTRPATPRGKESTEPEVVLEPEAPALDYRDRQYRGCCRLEAYETLEKLGEGTFGEVYKARDKETDDLVALKLILMHNEKDGFPITALREIKILKQLNHPNIVKVANMAHVTGNRTTQEKGKIFMVFPYMDHDLSGLLENPRAKLTVPQIKLYMRQLLEGVAYLHANRILHRDLKAANLLVSNAGVLQIADFGLARPFEVENDHARMHAKEKPGPSTACRHGMDYTGCVVTRWYRPPELLLGERKYGPAIDMWGVGCVFGEFYRGKPILAGVSDLDQLDKIFALCGSPTTENMPGWTELPGCEGVASFRTQHASLRSDYKIYGTEMADLLAKLLTLDPAKRITAEEALDEDYLWLDPLPADPASLAKYDPSKEYDKRKRVQH